MLPIHTNTTSKPIFGQAKIEARRAYQIFCCSHLFERRCVYGEIAILREKIAEHKNLCRRAQAPVNLLKARFGGFHCLVRLLLQ